MSTIEAKKGLPPVRHRPAVALCLVGVWFSSGCNLGELIDPEGNLRETATYRASHEDNLLDVARRFNLGYVEMVAANPGTDPWLPGAGTEVVLPTVHLMPEAEAEGIVINLADMRLYYFDEAGGATAILSDRHWPGRAVARRWAAPRSCASVRTRPGGRPSGCAPRTRSYPRSCRREPENPLGDRAMYHGMAAISHSRHQQAVGHWSAGQQRLHSDVSRRRSQIVRSGRGRNEGHGGRSADQARLDRR